jgi:hypothetical protein
MNKDDLVEWFVNHLPELIKAVEFASQKKWDEMERDLKRIWDELAVQ